MRWRLPRFDRTTVIVIATALVLGAGYWALVSWAASVYRTASPVPSVTNDGSAGLSVYFGYLDALGLKPMALRQFTELPKGATIVAAGPFQALPTKAETKRLAAWVRGGGRLVLAGSGAGLLLDGLGLKGTPSQALNGIGMDPVVPSVYSAGVSRVEPGVDRLAADAPEWVVHYRDSEGAVLLSAVQGRGEIVWLAGTDVVSNEGIGRGDNAALAVRLASQGGRAVYFDEFHLGFADDASLWTRLGAGGQAAMVLVALATVALMLARGRRLGPALAPREEPPARSSGYIASLGELYRKAGARSEALMSLEDGLARALARRYGTVEAGLARRPQVREALDASRRLRTAGATLGKDEFMAAARSLRRARREVEGHV